MKRDQVTPWELTHALETARRGGCVIQITLSGATPLRFYSVSDVAEMLEVNSSWVRAHYEEFPNRVLLPGGDIRIPIADIQAALERWRGNFPAEALKRLQLSES
jgi:hypothetical protein